MVFLGGQHGGPVNTKDKNVASKHQCMNILHIGNFGLHMDHILWKNTFQLKKYIEIITPFMM